MKDKSLNNLKEYNKTRKSAPVFRTIWTKSPSPKLASQTAKVKKVISIVEFLEIWLKFKVNIIMEINMRLSNNKRINKTWEEEENKFIRISLQVKRIAISNTEECIIWDSINIKKLKLKNIIKI